MLEDEKVLGISKVSHKKCIETSLGTTWYLGNHLIVIYLNHADK